MAWKDHDYALSYWKQYNAKRRPEKPKTPRQIAIENGDKYYFSEKPCVKGHTAQRRTGDRICTECDRVKKEALRKERPEHVKALKKKDYEKNKASHLAQKKEYRQTNKGKINALVATRKASKKQRTPKWADKKLIRAYYNVCSFFNEVNGYVKYHVDHDIPLQGELVSGLHVHNNLRILPWQENISKKNKFEIV